MDVPEWVKKHRAGEPLTVDDLADAIESIFDAFDRLIEDLLEEKHPMGAFDAVDNITIPDDGRDPEGAAAFRAKWKWEPHETITVRGSYTAADQEAVENASSTVVKDGKKRELDVRGGTARRKLLEMMIVSWTLAYNGAPVPVTKEAIGKLPPNYRNPVLEVVDMVTEGMNEEELQAFLSAASTPTSGS